jgi:hypothetical protein
MSNVSDQEFFRACARFIVGESTGVSIKGSSDRLRSLQEVLHASRDLYRALEAVKPLSEVGPLIERKSRASARFRDETGISWIL